MWSTVVSSNVWIWFPQSLHIGYSSKRCRLNVMSKNLGSITVPSMYGSTMDLNVVQRYSCGSCYPSAWILLTVTTDLRAVNIGIALGFARRQPALYRTAFRLVLRLVCPAPRRRTWCPRVRVIKTRRVESEHVVNIQNRLPENVGLRLDLLIVARRVRLHVFVQEALQISRVELESIDECEEAQNDLPLDEPRLGRWRSSDLAPAGSSSSWANRSLNGPRKTQFRSSCSFKAIEPRFKRSKIS